MAVGDLWQKTLVYFGMADPDDDYDDYVDDLDDGSPHQELERSYRERPNVRRLGPRRRESSDFDDIYTEEPRAARPSMARGSESSRAPAPKSEVHLVVPRSFNDAQQIADRFKETVPVILNLQSAEVDLAKRLIDFASGLTYALNGGMQRVADKVFLLTPADIEVSAEERARLVEKGFFNQY